MDVGMPLLNGIEATKAFLKQSPSTGVVILSMHSDESYVMRSLQAGARAYLLKDSAPSDLLSAIEAVSHGKSFFSSAIRHLLAEDYVRVLRQKGAVDSYELLTMREREILQLVAEGKTNKEVASSLNISLYTVETHRSNILEKLGIHSPAELILYAVRKGIIH
jgi:two-component system, NarL family, response regulator NreC